MSDLINGRGPLFIAAEIETYRPGTGSEAAPGEVLADERTRECNPAHGAANGAPGVDDACYSDAGSRAGDHSRAVRGAA